MTVPLNYLSNFLISREMALIICRVEWKPKCTNHCVLSANCNDNDDASSNNVIFNINDTNYDSVYPHYQQKLTKTFQKVLVKGLKDHVLK